MIKSCFKLIPFQRIYNKLLDCPRVSPRTITSKRLCWHNNQESGKTTFIRKYRKELNEMQLIQYENRFQDQRYDKLSPINASDYKKWLNITCLQTGDSSVAFERKFRRLQLICGVYNDILQKTFRVPSELTTNSILDLLEVESHEDIAKQINFLYELQMKRWIQKQLRKEDVVKTKEKNDLKYSGRTSRIGIFDDKNEIVYGLWHNTLFTRIKYEKNKKSYIARTRLKNSAIFGQKVVIDFGFEEFLDKISSKQLMSYLVKSISFNRYYLDDPFDISFNNFDSSGFLMTLLDNYFHKHDLREYYIDVTSDSYMDRFDFADLCYICPQAEEPLREYDYNAVYVLPAVVYNRMDPPLSLMRVKHEGIQMKRIPVEDYGILKHNYHLELPQSLQILSHFRDFNDMNKALELFVPKTVWKDDNRFQDEDQNVIKNLFYKKMIGSQWKAKTYRKIDS